ncbi:MAG: glycosyltransferase family 2 protein [bacterium]|nr:glycosyltransferase family 2 protein [bacterium]
MSENVKKLPVSLCIIAKNEAKNITGCLRNIGEIPDETLLLDTGSDDGTPEVAIALGASVFHYEWNEDYAKARNTLVEKAKNDWILWIDCDEVYPPGLIDEIKQAVLDAKDHSGYYFPRKNHYFGKWLKYGGHYPDYQLKMYRKTAFKGYLNRLHEKVELTGTVGKMNTPCEHHPFRTVDDYLGKFNRYTTIDAKILFEKGETTGLLNTLSWLFFKPVFRFIRRYFFKGGFLNGKAGFFAAFFDSATYIVRYTKLWKLKTESNSTEIRHDEND